MKKPVRVLPRELYLEPTSVCNLKCRMCYTNVINGENRRVLDTDKIFSFVQRFVEADAEPATLYWCGTGEVFMHRGFPALVNRVAAAFADRAVQTIQTNGTVHRLDELDDPARLSFRISIDGTKPFHDWHRGEGTYDKSVDFCAEALRRGASVMVRSLLTRDNIDHLDELSADLEARCGRPVPVRVMTVFTNSLLRQMRDTVPGVNRNDIDDTRVIPEAEAREVLRARYGDRYELEEESPAVDNYLAVNTYGVYTCCNGVVSIGDLDTELDVLRTRLNGADEACRTCTLFPCM